MFSRLTRRLLLSSALTLIASSLFLFQAEAASSPMTLKLGVIPGPEEDLILVAKDVAHSKGLDVDLVRFGSYALPNEALAGKDIDANAFQHKFFLDTQVKARGYSLSILGKTWVEPLGFYSHKIKNIKELPDNARIGVPNDPSNQGRALNLLAKYGLISLEKNPPELPNLSNIAENPHHFQFIELDAAQLPRALDDLTIAAINTNYVIAAGIDPKSTLLQEPRENNPYANIVVVRKGEESRPEMKILIESIQSAAVRKEMKTKFHGAILPAW